MKGRVRRSLKSWFARQMAAAPAWTRESFRPRRLGQGYGAGKSLGKTTLRTENALQTVLPAFGLLIFSIFVVVVHAVGNVVFETVEFVFVPPRISAAPKALQYRRLIARLNLLRSDCGLDYVSEYKPVERRWTRAIPANQIPQVAESTEVYEYKPHDSAPDDPPGANFDF